MQSPPVTLDGARVLKFAGLTPTQTTGQMTTHIGDEPLTEFAAIALAKYDNDPGVYIFYCDIEWNVLTDMLHATRRE